MEEFLALAKKYTNSQRLGYSEIAKHTVSFDGNLAGRDLFPVDMGVEGGVYVKILDFAITPNNKPEIVVDADTQKVHYSLDNNYSYDDGLYIYSIVDSESVPVISVPHSIDAEDGVTIDEGTYVLHETKAAGGAHYVSLLSYIAETIHPIDPKYLPGVCLPVVELTLEQLDEIPQGSTKGYSEGPIYEQFERAFQTGLPWVLRIPVELGAITQIMTSEDGDFDGFDSALKYSCTLFGVNFIIGRVVFDGHVLWGSMFEKPEEA